MIKLSMVRVKKETNLSRESRDAKAIVIVLISLKLKIIMKIITKIIIKIKVMIRLLMETAVFQHIILRKPKLKKRLFV